MVELRDTPASRSLVRGFIWKCRMNNGAEFEFWTSTSAYRQRDARDALLALANGDYGTVYESRDIERIWRVKGNGS